MTESPDRTLRAAVEALDERKAERLSIIDLRGRIPFADWFVVCHGTSERQVRALAEAVESHVRDVCGRKPSKEGENGAEWILLDYGDVLVHVFTEEARDFYRLDRLWGDAEHLSPSAVLGAG
jgi:ribosome-associated protein